MPSFPINGLNMPKAARKLAPFLDTGAPKVLSLSSPAGIGTQLTNLGRDAWSIGTQVFKDNEPPHFNQKVIKHTAFSDLYCQERNRQIGEVALAKAIESGLILSKAARNIKALDRLKAKQAAYEKSQKKCPKSFLNRSSFLVFQNLTADALHCLGLYQLNIRYCQSLKKPKINKLAEKIKKLEFKLQSCSEENQQKIRADLAKGKQNKSAKGSETYYRQKAMRYMLQATCGQEYAQICKSNSTKKQQIYARKALYQKTQKDWVKAARRAYWPRLLGASSHMTGAVLMLAGLLMHHTSLSLIAPFLIGASRMLGDLAQGTFRLHLKNFEEMSCRGTFFKLTGLLEKGAGVHQANQGIDLLLKEITAAQSQLPNLYQIIEKDLPPAHIQALSKRFNPAEKAMSENLKTAFKVLRAARYREKNETDGSTYQLICNLFLGTGQLLLNLLKFIPEPTAQIAFSGASLGLATVQNAANFFNAPKDFCNKMEQTFISHINLTSIDSADKKLKLQYTLSDLKQQQKKYDSKEINQKQLQSSQKKVEELMHHTQNLKEDLVNAAIQPMHFRLKNLQEYQNIKTGEYIHQMNQRQEKMNTRLDQLQKTKPFNAMNRDHLLKNIDLFYCRAQNNDLQSNDQQREWLHELKNLQQKQQSAARRLEKMLADFDCLQAIASAKSGYEVNQIIHRIRDDRLRFAIDDQSAAIQLTIEGKKMLAGERFRYFISYAAPSIISGMVLAPLLITPAAGWVSGSGSGSGSDENMMKRVNSCITNLVGAYQQMGTGSNNAERDVYKAQLQKGNQPVMAQTNAGHKIKDTRKQFNNDITPAPEIKTYSHLQSIKRDISFIAKCAFGSLTGVWQQHQAAKKIDALSYKIDCL